MLCPASLPEKRAFIDISVAFPGFIQRLDFDIKKLFNKTSAACPQNSGGLTQTRRLSFCLFNGNIRYAYSNIFIFFLFLI